jgi:hypothetical protein
MDSVFVVQHLHVTPDGCDDVKMIGIYRTRAAAESAVARLAQQPGLCEFPRIVDCDRDSDDQGFHISEYPLDLDHWEQGYVTV